jgi:hypothetical protein
MSDTPADPKLEKVLQAFRKVDAELDARGLAALRTRLEELRCSYLRHRQRWEEWDAYARRHGITTSGPEKPLP